MSSPDDPEEFRNWSLPDDPSLQVLSLKRLQSLEYISLNCEDHCIRIGALENLVGKHPSIQRISLGLEFDLDADKVADIAKTLLKFVEVDLTNGSFFKREDQDETNQSINYITITDETAGVVREILLASTREDSNELSLNSISSQELSHYNQQLKIL